MEYENTAAGRARQRRQLDDVEQRGLTASAADIVALAVPAAGLAGVVAREVIRQRDETARERIRQEQQTERTRIEYGRDGGPHGVA